MRHTYDYLIVGAGLFGATFACKMDEYGKKCLVIEKSNHIGGLCHTQMQNGIWVHKHGPHVFHTKHKRIWDFIKQHADFNNYYHRVKALWGGGIYSFPINLQTMQETRGRPYTPEEMKKELAGEQKTCDDKQNFKNYCISKMGPFLYEMFIEKYTMRQWGCDAAKLSVAIAKRIPVRYTFNDSYYPDDEYQGIPRLGYTRMISRMLKDTEVKLNTDFFEDRKFWETTAKKVVFTGRIDELFDFEYGKLPYRKTYFREELMDIPDYQGIAVVNHVAGNELYTRTTEHKHFLFDYGAAHTIITYEYPHPMEGAGEITYPINTEKNDKLYERYSQRLREYSAYIAGGRLAEYQYMNMDETIMSAMDKMDRELSKIIG